MANDDLDRLRAKFFAQHADWGGHDFQQTYLGKKLTKLPEGDAGEGARGDDFRQTYLEKKLTKLPEARLEPVSDEALRSKIKSAPQAVATQFRTIPIPDLAARPKALWEKQTMLRPPLTVRPPGCKF
jgi:hypothetical protein